ncbi:MAG: helix-turn-helix domain-containing protein, partial [Gammaproteobacteria bacterium]
LEAARYTADKAFRQYDAADPANRLVASELEVRWNRALGCVAELQTRIDKYIAETPAVTPAGAADFISLAADLKVIWRDLTTDVPLKKRIVRELIREVIADVDATGGEIILMVHWAGGVHTELRVPRRRRGQQRKSTAPEIIEAVRMLACKCTDDVIAGVLTRNDLRTGNGNRWTRERVTSLRNYHGIPVYRSDTCEAEGWMNLTQAAVLLGISPKTLRVAAEQGEIEATHPLAEGPWLFKRAILEREETKCLVERVRRRRSHPTGPKYQQPNLFESMTWRDR